MFALYFFFSFFPFIFYFYDEVVWGSNHIKQYGFYISIFLQNYAHIKLHIWKQHVCWEAAYALGAWQDSIDICFELYGHCCMLLHNVTNQFALFVGRTRVDGKEFFRQVR